MGSRAMLGLAAVLGVAGALPTLASAAGGVSPLTVGGSPAWVTSYGEGAIFENGCQVFRTDGTPAGTTVAPLDPVGLGPTTRS
jgi:hypothetical protein